MIHYRFARMIMYIGIFLQAISDQRYWSMITPAMLMFVDIADYLEAERIKK